MANDEIPFASIDGEMAQRVRAFEWSATALGPISTWPQSLKTAAGIVLLSPVPIVMLWGPEGVMIYNDAYSSFAGQRHPTLLGSKVREGWPEVADFNDNVMKAGLAGRTLAYRDQELTLYRSGLPEQVWMNLDYSPIHDESGAPAGVMAIVVETTQRVRTEAALRKSEEQLRLATEAAEVGLWDVDNLTDTLFWPPRVKAMFGISPDAPVSMADFYAGLHPNDRDYVSAAYTAACDTDQRALYDVEYRTIGKEDGRERWVAAKGRGIFDETGQCVRVIGTAIDITSRKKIEQQLREWNETLEREVERRTAERDRVWRYSRDLLIVIDRDGLLSAVNPAWTEILGHPATEAIGRPFLEFVIPDDMKSAADAMTAARLKNGLINFEIWHPHKRGTVRLISWLTAVEDGLIYAYGRDITDAKAQAAALAKAEAALNQAQKMEAVGQLTGGIAHDFNNLLQSIIGSFDLIKRRPEQRDRVLTWSEAGLKAAQRGAKLTAQLLAFSRAQKLEVKPANVSTLLSGMRELLDRTLGPLIRVCIDDQETEGAYILCDQTQLEMAILNLAINARDAMPEGGEVRIATKARTLSGDAELPSGRYIELSVSDTGFGMPEDIVNKAFEPFFTTKGLGKGTGLGLSQVYAMARQTGGTARLESRPGKGTTVRLLLQETDSSRATAGKLGGDGQFKVDRPAFILVVDDDLDVRTSLTESLSMLGHRVLDAEDGYAGLSIMAEVSPDLVIIDYAMPGMTGVEMARELRVKSPNLPIIFASGYADTAAVESVVDALTCVLRKPFELAELHGAISRLLEKAATGIAVLPMATEAVAPSGV